MKIYITTDGKGKITQWGTSLSIGDIEVELPDDHEFFSKPCTWYKYENGEVVKRNKDEIEGDIDLRPQPPTSEERLAELENAFLTLLLEKVGEGGEK